MSTSTTRLHTAEAEKSKIEVENKGLKQQLSILTTRLHTAETEKSQVEIENNDFKEQLSTLTTRLHTAEVEKDQVADQLLALQSKHDAIVLERGQLGVNNDQLEKKLMRACQEIMSLFMHYKNKTIANHEFHKNQLNEYSTAILQVLDSHPYGR